MRLKCYITEINNIYKLVTIYIFHLNPENICEISFVVLQYSKLNLSWISNFSKRDPLLASYLIKQLLGLFVLEMNLFSIMNNQA